MQGKESNFILNVKKKKFFLKNTVEVNTSKEEGIWKIDFKNDVFDRLEMTRIVDLLWFVKFDLKKIVKKNTFVMSSLWIELKK